MRGPHLTSRRPNFFHCKILTPFLSLHSHLSQHTGGAVEGGGGRVRAVRRRVPAREPQQRRRGERGRGEQGGAGDGVVQVEPRLNGKGLVAAITKGRM